jgi:hypothetical protein
MLGEAGDCADIDHISHVCLADNPCVDPTAVLPVLAAGFAVPQFVPQLHKLRRTGDTAGLSVSWALLTGVNNAAWLGYFAASGYWLALLPSGSTALLAGALGVTLARRVGTPRRTKVSISAWAILLGATAIADQRLLGAVLTAAFVIQVVPAVTAAYRSSRPSGIATATWRLILAETTCWAVFGAAQRDAPLIVLGATGTVSALLMLRRATSTADNEVRACSRTMR